MDYWLCSQYSIIASASTACAKIYDVRNVWIIGCAVTWNVRVLLTCISDLIFAERWNAHHRSKAVSGAVEKNLIFILISLNQETDADHISGTVSCVFQILLICISFFPNDEMQIIALEESRELLWVSDLSLQSTERWNAAYCSQAVTWWWDVNGILTFNRFFKFTKAVNQQVNEIVCSSVRKFRPRILCSYVSRMLRVFFWRLIILHASSRCGSLQSSIEKSKELLRSGMFIQYKILCAANTRPRQQ